MNPTSDVFEQRIADLEGGVGALAASSGHAAQTMAILTLCGAGDHIVSASTLYGGTYNQFNYTFPRLGIEVTFVDPADPENFRRAIRPNTKILYGETLGNPRINVFPFEEVAAIAREHRIPLMIDNTFATPYLCRPFEWGANIVIHSTTKFIGGHGTSIGGIIVDGGNFDWAGNRRFPNFTSPIRSYHGLVYASAAARRPSSPRRACRSCATSAPASRRSTPGCSCRDWKRSACAWSGTCKNAQAVAEFLEKHPKVSWVTYPGLKSHPDYAAAQEISAQRPRRDPGLWHQGRRWKPGASSSTT